MTVKPQHITLKGIKQASKKAYDEDRLLAQSGERAYGYRIGKFVCAIGAGLNSETLDRIDQDCRGNNTVSTSPGENLIENYFTFSENDREGLCKLQDAHDEWYDAAKRLRFAKMPAPYHSSSGEEKVAARCEAGFLSLIL